LLYHISLMMT